MSNKISKHVPEWAQILVTVLIVVLVVLIVVLLFGNDQSIRVVSF